MVRERYWLTFQPGEIRTCASCHGLNQGDQLNRDKPQNKPQALAALMQFYKNLPTLGAPLNLQVVSVVGSTVTLAWAGGAGQNLVTGYVVEGGLTPGTVAGSIPTGSTGTTFTFPAPTGAFYVRVRALAGTATGPASNEVRVFVNVPAPPDVPRNLTGNAVGPVLQLAWTNGTAGGAATAMLLNVTGALSLTLPLPPASETFSYPAVPPGTYTFAVQAQNAVGTSAASNAVTLTFPGTCTPPGTPTNLRLTRAGNVATAAWDSPASGGAPDAYTLAVTGSFTGSFATTGRALSGVVGPGSYTVAVTSGNSCGTSPPSPPVTLTVP